MIYCRINGKNMNVQHTHPNNSGQVTTFFYHAKGCVSPRSFNLSEFETVEDFLKTEYKAKILETLEY